MRKMHLLAPFGTKYLRVLVAVLALLAGFLLPLVVAPSAQAASCSGKSYSWTGNGDGRSWTDAQNWSPSDGTPSSTDEATIESTNGEVFIDNPHSVCDLTLTANSNDVFFHAGGSSGGGITVSNDLNINGSADGSVVEHWDGNITVGGATTITGAVEYDDVGNFPTDIRTLTTKNLVIEPNANVDLPSGSTDIHSTGVATIGQSTIWSNNSSANDDIAQLQVDGLLQLTGDVDAELDVVLHDGSTLDLAGHTLDVHSHSYSWWSNSTVESSSGHGVVKFRDGTWLLLNQTVTIDPGATLQMQDDTHLSDSANYPGSTPAELNGTTGAIAGGGNLDWIAGHLIGHVTLGPNLTTRLDGNGDRRIEQVTGTVLTNKGRMIVVNGDLDVPADPGQIVNDGSLVLNAGVTVTGSSVQTDIVNTSSGTVQVSPSQADPTAKIAVLEATVANHGTIGVPHGYTLQLNGGGMNALRQGGTLTGGGTLQVTDQTTVLATGTTTITGGSTLDYNGYNSSILAGSVTSKGVWTATGTLTTPTGQHGTLSWRQGQIDGHLALTGALNVKITDPGNGAKRDLGGNTDYDQSQLTLGSPTTVNNAVVRVNNNSALLIADAVRMTGAAPALGTGYGDPAQGALLHVLPSGSVTVAGPSSTVHPVAVMDYPVVNSGTVTVPAGSKLQLPTSFKQNGGSLRGGGQLIGNIVVARGVVRPSLSGGAPSTLTIAGTYRQGAHAKLVLLVAGGRTSRHDRLVVTSAALLAGTIAPVLKDGYRPTVGTKFVALSAASRAGKFGTVVSAGVPRHTHWKQLLGQRTVTLKLVR